MHWVVLAIGIVLGGILRLLYDKKKNRVLNILSFIVPFGFGIAFWILLFETGYNPKFFSTTVEGLEYTGATAQTSKWIMIILTSCIFAGISWGFGALISLLSEKLHKGGKEKKSKKG